MDEQEKNASGCPLHNQTGEQGVRDFATLIRLLPPELRAAFERERDARQRELDSYRQSQAQGISLAA